MSPKHLNLGFIVLIFLSVTVNARAESEKCDYAQTLQAITPRTVKKPIVLFKSLGRPEAGYERWVEKLKPGDVIQFGDGSQNTIRKILGSGDTSLVLDVGGGKAIRISINADERANEAFDSFRLEQRYLKEAGVPIVEMKTSENIPYQKIVVGRENFKFTLYDYFHEGVRDSMSKIQRKEIEEKLIDFARKTWSYKMIGDFEIHQMGFTDKGEWLLFDTSSTGAMWHSDPLFDLNDKGNIFSPFRVPSYGISETELWHDRIPPKLYAKIEDAILEERKLQRKNGHWLKRSGYDQKNLINHLTSNPLPEGRRMTRESMFVLNGKPLGEDFYDQYPELNFTEGKHLYDEKSLGVYQAKLSNGKPAILKLLVDEDPKSKKALKKAIKAANENGSLMVEGNDFVLVNS